MQSYQRSQTIAEFHQKLAQKELHNFKLDKARYLINWDTTPPVLEGEEQKYCYDPLLLANSTPEKFEPYIDKINNGGYLDHLNVGWCTPSSDQYRITFYKHAT